MSKLREAVQISAEVVLACTKGLLMFKHVDCCLCVLMSRSMQNHQGPSHLFCVLLVYLQRPLWVVEIGGGAHAGANAAIPIQ